ncbi:MAG: hypothetical protein CMF62_03315 [Magnetococcales bacterium]|nr:hypothetical protein [Magnetococcales bacterium]|tara:strand:+ start:2942 stop:5368 length:2427 start_codon:yes stop_codon:yes gene_type:complete
MADDDIGTLIGHCVNDRIDYALFFIEAGLYDINEVAKNHEYCFGGNCFDGSTALDISVMRNQQIIVEKLLSIPELNIDHVNSQGLTALHVAILNNKPDIAKLLIMNGASTTIKTNKIKSTMLEKNSSPLLLACINPLTEKWIEIIKLLADKDDELDQQNDSGLSPLYACMRYSIEDENFEIFDYLLEKGFKADIIYRNNGLNCLDYAESGECEYIIEKLNAIPDYKRNYSTLILNHLDKAFFGDTSIEKKNESYEKIKDILEKNTIELNLPIQNTTRWNKEDTFLHYVCFKGDLRFIKLFIEHGSDINAKNSIGITPIMYTLYSENDEVIEYFFNLEGIDFKTKLIENYRYNRKDSQVIDIAFNIGSIKFIELYNSIEDINFDKLSSDGETYLMKAIRLNKEKLVEYLLNQNHDVNIELTKSSIFRFPNYDRDVFKGYTALHYSILCKNQKIINHITDHIDKFTKRDYSSFRLALKCNNPNIAKFIIPNDFSEENKKETLNIIIDKEHTEYNELFDNLYEKKIINSDALSLAVIKGNDYIASKLFDDSFDPNKKFDDETDLIKKGSALIHYTIALDMEDFFDKLIKNSKTDLNIENSKKQTPLYLAFEFDRLDMVEKLVEHGANVNIKISDDIVSNQTVLMKIVYNGMHEMALSLLKTKSIDINSIDDYGRTALVYAVLKNHEQLAIDLIKNGANLNIEFKNTEKGKILSLPILIVKKGLDKLLCFITEKGLVDFKEDIPSLLKKITEPIVGCSISSCTYCMENEKSIVFLPCGHCVSCEECYDMSKDKMNSCPICRKAVTSTVKVYF